MVFPLGRKPLSLNSISLLYLRLKRRSTKDDRIWPMTVATAAPATPIFGQPSRPKIMIGSRMMFVIAPTIWPIIESFVFPVDCSRRA